MTDYAYRITVLGAAVGLVCIGVAAAIALPTDNAEQGRMGLIIAILGPTLTALLALLRTDTANKKVDQVKDNVADHLEQHAQLVTDALHELGRRDLTVEQAAHAAAALLEKPKK